MFLRWVECRECQYRLEAPVFDMPPFVITQLGWTVIRAGLSGGGERFYLRPIIFVLAVLAVPICSALLLVSAALYWTVNLAVFVLVRRRACPRCANSKWSWPITRWDFS
jgi:hypothetical protein